MKNTFTLQFILAVSIFMVPFCSKSQSFDHIFQPDFYARTQYFYKDLEGNYNISSISHNFFGYGNESLWLTKMDSSGNVLFHNALVGGERLIDAHWIPAPDGKLVVLFNAQLCDVGGYWQITGLDQGGYEEWLIEAPFNSGDVHIYPYNSTLFCIQTPESLFFYNYEGFLISQQSTDLPVLNRHIFLDQEIILAYDPSIALFEHSELTHENQSITGVKNARKLVNSNGYAVVNAEELILLDSSLDITSMVNLSMMGEIIDFDISPDGFWVLMEDVVVQLDAGLNVTGQIPVPFEGVRIPLYIAYAQDQLTIGGDEVPVSCIDEKQGYFIQAFHPENKISFENNVSVQEVWTPLPPMAEIGLWGYEVSISELHIVIENIGNDTINSISVFGRKGLEVSICQMSNEYNFLFSDLSIAPGESKDFNLGDFFIPFQLFLSPFNMCFWAITPNGQTDYDRSDNCLCEDFEVIVSNKDITNLLSLNISPNPNSGNFTISGIPENLSRLKIYNAAGICVYDTLPPVSEGTADIMLSQNLSSGVYFLVTNEEHSGSISRKFILQNF